MTTNFKYYAKIFIKPTYIFTVDKYKHLISSVFDTKQEKILKTIIFRNNFVEYVNQY